MRGQLDFRICREIGFEDRSLRVEVGEELLRELLRNY